MSESKVTGLMKRGSKEVSRKNEFRMCANWFRTQPNPNLNIIQIERNCVQQKAWLCDVWSVRKRSDSMLFVIFLKKAWKNQWCREYLNIPMVRGEPDASYKTCCRGTWYEFTFPVRFWGFCWKSVEKWPRVVESPAKWEWAYFAEELWSWALDMCLLSSKPENPWYF